MLDIAWTRDATTLASRAPGCATLARMGTRNPERGRLRGMDEDRLAEYDPRIYTLTLCCSRAECGHEREISVPQMLRWLRKPEATIADMRRRCYCHRCHSRFPDVRVTFHWKMER
jgi:hypothetical protein